MPYHIDLMRDNLTIEELKRLCHQQLKEHDFELGVQYMLLIRAMLYAARGKAKKTILEFRLEQFFKKLAKEFHPEFSEGFKKELEAELGWQIEEAQVE